MIKKNIKFTIYIFLLTDILNTKTSDDEKSIKNEIIASELTDLHFTPHLNTDNSQLNADFQHQDLAIQLKKPKLNVKSRCLPKFSCIIS